MKFIVQTYGELATADFLGVNVTHGVVLEICQADLARPVVQEAIRNQWIVEIRSKAVSSPPSHSRLIGKIEGNWKISTGLSDRVAALTTQVAQLQQENSDMAGVKGLLLEQNKKLEQLLLQTSQPRTLVVEAGRTVKSESTAVEVDVPFVPSPGDISKAKAKVQVKEKAGGGVDDATAKLRALRQEQKR